MWNKELISWLVNQGFKQSKVEPCLLTKQFEDGGVMYLICYVDDILLAGSSMAGMDEFVSTIKEQWKVKDLGEPTQYLGFQIERGSETIKLHQAAYIERLVERFGLSKAHSQPTPAASSVIVGAAMSPRTVEEYEQMKNVPYREAVGALLYCSTMTRPDIANAVRIAARYCDKPGPGHWAAVKRILRYLLATKERGLVFGKRMKRKSDLVVDPLELFGFVDADWGSDPDGRRSTTGVVLMFGGAACTWASRLQCTVALSSSESEYLALSDGCKETMYVRSLLMSLCPQSQATVLYEDNEGALKLAYSQTGGKRTKHIDIRHHHIRDCIQSGHVEVRSVKTIFQHADGLTKNLDVAKFMTHSSFIMND
jgi:hypothetical protein